MRGPRSSRGRPNVLFSQRRNPAQDMWPYSYEMQRSNDKLLIYDHYMLSTIKKTRDHVSLMGHFIIVSQYFDK